MKLIDIQKDLKSRFSLDIVLIQSGFYFSVYNEDADLLNKYNGNKLYEQGENILTGFPVSSLEYYKDLLIDNSFKYAFVEQTQKENDLIIREVTHTSYIDAMGIDYKKKLRTSKKEKEGSFLMSILNGFNPLTGEIFEEESPWKSKEVLDLIKDFKNIKPRNDPTLSPEEKLMYTILKK